MTKTEQAKHCFGQGFNCAQAVIGVFSQNLGIDKDTAMKLSTGLGSGLRCGEVCGAVTGAAIVIGLKYGHGREIDEDAKKKTHALITEFEKRFAEENGSIVCKDILTYDLSNEEELKIIREQNLFETICPDIVESAVEILDEIL